MIFFEFFIGGYGSDNRHGEIWKIAIEAGVVIPAHQIADHTGTGSVFWGGQGDAIARLIHGVDAQAIDVLQSIGLDESVAVAIFNAIRSRAHSPLCWAAMPVIDAINLARYLVATTTGFFSFSPGSNIVGGEADIATVTKWEGFKWINRKHYYKAELNRRDHDHVS